MIVIVIQVIAQQLEPYIRSITAMMERVQPEVLVSSSLGNCNWQLVRGGGFETGIKT